MFVGIATRFVAELKRSNIAGFARSALRVRIAVVELPSVRADAEIERVAPRGIWIGDAPMDELLDSFCSKIESPLSMRAMNQRSPAPKIGRVTLWVRLIEPPGCRLLVKTKVPRS